MTKRILGKLAAVGATVALAIHADAALAHDVWLTLAGETSARRVVVNYGHPDDRPPPFADKVLDLIAIKSNGKTSLVKGLIPKFDHGAFVVESETFADDGHVLLAASYDNGYWVKLPGGLYRNVTRRLAPDAVEALWSSKFAKTITGAGAPWQTVVGHDIEIVPLADPAGVMPGQGLKIRALFHGQPLAGAQVERGDGTTAVPEKDIPRFSTDEDGVATIPIVKSGPHLLVIDHRVAPSATPDQANADLYTATLWFTVIGKRTGSEH
jgi:nickel transport protein